MTPQRNQLVLLNKLLDGRLADSPQGTDPAFIFELFTAEQIIRDYELSDDEVRDGIVGGGQDGGIDSIYVFLNGSLLAEDSEVFNDDVPLGNFNRELPISIVCIQSKRSTGFSEEALVTAKASLEQLLDLTKKDDALRTIYNDRIVEKFGLFKKAVTKLAPRRPKISASFIYASKGNSSAVANGPRSRAEQLKETLTSMTGAEQCEVRFVGAEDLWKLANTMPSYTLELEYQEDLTEGTSHVALVKIRDYIKFLTSKEGSLQRHIFEMNVRDYQGSGVEVNREITRTVLDPNAPEFWWMNNGVTIVCTNASSIGKVFQIDDVQIVNGLQTSFTLFEALKAANGDEPILDKCILVRLLVTGDSTTRDRVIRATNSQTKVPTASLRATEDLQREIEAYFVQHNWFYDRRKNYYKNIGKSRDRIVSIPFLAQAMISVGLGEPDQARARPSTLLKNDTDYKRVFPPDLDVAVYRYCLELQKKVDARLVSDGTATDERNNIRFHVSTLVIMDIYKSSVRHPSQLRSLASSHQLPTDSEIDNAIKLLRRLREDYSYESGVKDNSQIAKSSDFVKYMIAKATE